MRISIACLVVAFCAGFAGVTTPALAASPPPPPGSFSVVFDQWQNGTYLISLSWEPVAGATHYTIQYTSGDHPDATTGYQFASVDGSVTQITQEFAPDVLDNVDTFVIAATTDSYGMGTAPATAVLDLPRPHLTVSPVNGKVGEIQVNTSPAFPGDAVDVTMRGAAGTAAQPVALGADGSTLLTGLDPHIGYSFQAVETRSDSADDVSPPAIGSAHPVPPAENLWPIGIGPWDDDPTNVPVAWSLPAGCDGMQPGNNCDLDFVIVKPGTTPSTDPSDGTNMSAAWDTVTNQFFSILRNIQVGETYTVTVFRTMDRVHWGPPASLTFTNQLMPVKSLAASPAQAGALGAPVTLTAKVTSPFMAPTGTVSFETNGSNRANVLCPPQPLPADGVVTCQTTTTAIASAAQEQVGTRLIFINYSGDHNFVGDRGFFIDYDVTKALPSLDAVHSAAPSIRRMVTIKSHVTGHAGVPTGTVKMTSGKRTLCRGVHLRSGRASCAIAGRKLGSGRHTVKVTYGGDGHYRVRATKLTFTVKH